MINWRLEKLLRQNTRFFARRSFDFKEVCGRRVFKKGKRDDA
ncbi:MULTISPECIES: hypothetical protein [unclassified Thermococcus]|nr:MULTISPECIES: hypothetical protein [unclassified Thermococcus]